MASIGAIDYAALSSEQLSLVGAVLRGKSLFYTGRAGTGKSLVARHIIAALRINGKIVAVTASTGTAAINIGGTTLHAFSGAQLVETDDIDMLVRRVHKSICGVANWTRTDVLFIDEIGMLQWTVLDRLDAIARRIRGSPAPFGGIQVVACGDFLQLPPICKPGEPTPGFAFHAKVWGALFADRQTTLTRNFRQSEAEAPFLEILGHLRSGSCPPHINALLQRHVEGCSSQRATKKPKNTTLLFTHNEDVARINAAFLAKILGPEHTYTATLTGDSSLHANLEKNCLAPKQLVLKHGAFVMFLKNKAGGVESIVNGSTGKVVALTKTHVTVKYDKGKTVVLTTSSGLWEAHAGSRRAMLYQVPLKLAYATTVHKAQGQTLARAKIDLSRSFGQALVYVALSRVQSMAGLDLVSFDPKAVSAHRDALDFHTKLEEKAAGAAQDAPAEAKSEALLAKLAALTAQAASTDVLCMPESTKKQFGGFARKGGMQPVRKQSAKPKQYHKQASSARFRPY